MTQLFSKDNAHGPCMIARLIFRNNEGHMQAENAGTIILPVSHLTQELIESASSVSTTNCVLLLTPSQTTTSVNTFENTVGKGEIACYKQFLLFPQCFLSM